MNKQERNKLIGSRLSECLKMKNIKPAELIRLVEKRTEKEGHKFIIDKAHLSRYMHGKGHLPAEMASEIAKELDIYDGYLLAEAPICKSYEEYLQFRQVIQAPSFLKYDKLLNYAQFGLSAGYSLDQYEYGIGSLIPDQDYSHKILSERSMQAFYEFLCSELRKTIKDNISNYAAMDELFWEMSDKKATIDEWKNLFETFPEYKLIPSELLPQSAKIALKEAAGRPTTQKRKGEKKNERKNE